MTILSSGKVETTQSTIFEATGFDILSGDTITVTKITFLNLNSIEQTVILYIKKRSETAMIVGQFKLLEDERGEYLEPGETIILNNGDVFQAETTTEAAVNFVVYGTRE